jgi:hypothetical protein
VNEWQQFGKSAATIMRDARDNKISLEAASNFFETASAITNPDLRRYAEAMIWEIDGSLGYYDELLRTFESSSSEDDVVRYIQK